MAMLLQRVATSLEPPASGTSTAGGTVTGSGSGSGSDMNGADASPDDRSLMSAREALEMATLGGARVLGRDDIGALAPGMAADIVTVGLDEIGMAGAQHDPLAALLFCQVPRVRHSVVDGRRVVRDGQLATLELPALAERHNRLARSLAQAASSTR